MKDPKGAHIGRALREHRQLVGVSREALAHAGNMAEVDVQWIEEAPEPSDTRVRYWWNAFELATTEQQRQADTRPVAQREQLYITADDTTLYSQALERRRGVHWWWGAARTPRGAGAVCYVCGELFHTYDIGRGVTFPVRISVMRHRADHLTGKRRPATVQTKGNTP